MNLLLEIGCEEIPARFIPDSLEYLKTGLEQRIQSARLEQDGKLIIETMGTPRRLVATVKGIAEKQSDLDEEILGPKVEAAFDSKNNPSKACIGFAKSRGVEVSQLERIDTPKGQVVGLKRHIEGNPAKDVLGEILTELLESISFPKSMRWGQGDFLFARPVHWLLILLNGEVIELKFAGVDSGRLSHGHRFTAPGPIEIDHVDNYVSLLQKRDVLVDPDERTKMVVESANKLAASVDGRLLHDPELEQEIVYLTEMPVAVLGRFDEKFLKLPSEVLVASMRNHQRYFSIERNSKKLLNAFIAFANTKVDDLDIVRHGFERVLTARLSDAEFFFETDKKEPPVNRVAKLQDMIFQADLGSYYEKAHRLGNLAVSLAYAAGLGGWEKSGSLIEVLADKTREVEGLKEQFSWRVARGSLLAKTDLLTEMVGEFPELQGEMGKVYAINAGENERVAEAIREHYLPRFSGDSIPETNEGAIVSLADRLDTLAGCFGVGLRPSGAADPYGLRRQCLGVIAIISGKEYRFSIKEMLSAAVSGVGDKVGQTLLRKAQAKAKKLAARKKIPAQIPTEIPPFEGDLVEDLMEFFAGRLRQRLSEEAPVDVVDAVMGASMDDITSVFLRVEALKEFLRQPAFENLAIAFKRVANIIKDFEGGSLDPKLFIEQEEKDLHSIYLEVKPDYENLLAASDYAGALSLLADKMRNPVDSFFDKVLVNDPNDPQRQSNRKALLAEIENLFGKIADFTKLQSKELE
jgi:glycyl-tRNA synthetase beta chain